MIYGIFQLFLEAAAIITHHDESKIDFITAEFEANYKALFFAAQTTTTPLAFSTFIAAAPLLFPLDDEAAAHMTALLLTSVNLSVDRPATGHSLLH